MSVACQRILSQKKMQDTRRLITFCYLCGENLPPRNKPGFRKQTIGEHIIPRTLLGNVPKNQSKIWPIELDVHRQCEEVGKQPVDHWLKLLQEIHTKPNNKWAKPGHFKNMPLYSSQVIQPQTGKAVPAFSGCSELFQGVWRWIRGLHAALYLQFSPEDICHFSSPPVPACSSQDGGPTLKETEEQSYLIRFIVDLAKSLDKWDGITAWSDEVQYRCVWKQCASATGKFNWVCFWTLSFPHLNEWSRQVLPTGSERPWHGNYASVSRPNKATFLTTKDFTKKT